MKTLRRITFDPEIMGGKPCIRGMRVTVDMIAGLVATGHSKEVTSPAVLITAYRPDPERWSDDFMRRKQ